MLAAMGSDNLHRSGSGDTVVLLHGITGSWHIWRPVIDRLEPSYDVLALTLPGHLGWQLPANRTLSVSSRLPAWLRCGSRPACRPSRPPT